jgi:hypothetical protein
MALWTKTDEAAGKPKFLTTAEKTVTFGVDTAEMGAERSQGTAPPHAGWILRTEGTGGRAGRVFMETLVAMGSVTGDLEDVKIQDLNIVIGTQPASDSSATVAATTVPTGGALTFAWSVSADAGATYAAATGGVYSGETTATLAISDNTGLDGNLYRCAISATGATTVTSTAATLTEA